MTAPNAPSYATELRAEQKAHEPSMEDILASIRRMIADDDVLPLSRRARAVARSRVETPDDAEATAPQKEPPDAFLNLVQRLGGESGGQTPNVSPPEAKIAVASLDDATQENRLAPAPAPVLPRAPTLKLRDFALKNFMARPAPPRDALPQDALAQDAPPHDASAQDAPAQLMAAEQTIAEPASASPGASVVMLSPRPSPAAEVRLKIAPLTYRIPDFATPPTSSVTLSPAPSPAPVAEKAPTPVPSEAALLSSASDAKIGASFEALAGSLLARDKDLVERAAREMLRPMLKSWLDDNLPSLVERLVRAEIERVARGRG